jgi:hypothetical protein
VNKTTEEWTKIDKSRYDGTCAGCGNKYAKDDPIYVCGGKYFCSTRCVGLVFTGAVEKGKKEDTTQGSSSSSSTPKVRCPLTQRFHPESEMVTVYTREHLPLRVSQLAVDMITVQYWAKVEGLWTVPRKGAEKPAEEAKA